MNWLIFAFLTALAVSTTDAWAKKYLSHGNPYEMAANISFYSLPILIITFPFIPTPSLDETFFWCVLISIPVNGAGLILYMKAIKSSPLSLAVPYLAFTPVFIILTGYLFLNEMPNKWGIFGILVICAGGYFIHLDLKKWKIFAPLKAIFKETGSWIMLIVAFIYSFGAVIGKKGILHSSPLYFSIAFFLVFNSIFVLFLLALGKIKINSLFKKSSIFNGCVVGLLFFLHISFHGYGISMVKAAYMISIKRFSILFSLFYGWLLFDEKNIPMRFFGASLMFCGALIITILGS